MIPQILEAIAAARRILVTAHGSPDGDALASTLALALALREMGKEAVAYNRDGAPIPFDRLPGADTLVAELPAGSRFDLTVVLDAGELKRAGIPEGVVTGTLANIDHHPHSERFGPLYWVDTEACATGILVYRLLRAADHALSQPVAICLYAAILADTGSFRYSNANPEAFTVAAELVGRGVNPWSVSHLLYESNRLPRLRLLAEVLRTLDVAPHGRFAAVHSTLEMMQRAGAGAADTDGFINYPRGLRGVEVAVYLRQTADDEYKVGFRSQGTYDVGQLARRLGGGGHRNASGVTLAGALDEVRSRVYAELDTLLA